MNKVLITGLGTICPLGSDKNASFAAALEARSAIMMVTGNIADRLPNLLFAPVTFDPEKMLEKKYLGLDRATQFALIAAHEAITNSGISTPVEDATRFGVFIGVGFGGANTIENLYLRYFETLHSSNKTESKPVVIHPLSVPRMMANAAAAHISMRYGLRGQSNTLSVACASSAIAVGEAFRAIRHGYLDAAVVVGTEAFLTPGSLTAWNALRVMAKPDPFDASQSCRPFSLNRSGLVLGEGAAAIVMESEARAKTRQPNIFAEMSGYGCSSDAEHLTAPSTKGQVDAMRQALADATLAPGQVQYLNAHGTGTDTGDAIESESIRTVFGEHTDRLCVSSTKAIHGHLIGAAGALEFVLSILAMNSGSIPPTAHLEKPDPRCDLDFVPLTARHGYDIEAVMSNSFAFGGSNAALIARRYPPWK